MEFVTIHDLSREFNIPARVVRYRFHQLLQTQKLAEGEDYRRDEYVDEQHFVWRINPLSFMRETGLAPVSKTLPIPALGATASGPELVNQKPPLVNEPVTNETKSVNQPADPVTKPSHPPKAVDTKPDGPSIEREMIDLLKEQVRTKDEQLREQSDHLKKINDLNVKLVGQTVQQAKQIEKLLQLTGGKTELNDLVTKRGNNNDHVGNEFDNQDADLGNSAPADGYQTTDHRAGQ